MSLLHQWAPPKIKHSWNLSLRYKEAVPEKSSADISQQQHIYLHCSLVNFKLFRICVFYIHKLPLKAPPHHSLWMFLLKDFHQHWSSAPTLRCPAAAANTSELLKFPWSEPLLCVHTSMKSESPGVSSGCVFRVDQLTSQTGSLSSMKQRKSCVP